VGPSSFATLYTSIYNAGPDAREDEVNDVLAEECEKQHVWALIYLAYKVRRRARSVGGVRPEAPRLGGRHGAPH
jgi:hypothetical protein